MSRHSMKPLGRKSYGHIVHLPGSRMGPGDHHCHEGQARICTGSDKKHYSITVTEKLDGSNCAIARLQSGEIVALGRAGYLAETSPYEQHVYFAAWVHAQADRWDIIEPNQRLVGEWMAQAHGTRYKWEGDPFVPFDLMIGEKRSPLSDLREICAALEIKMPALVSDGPCSIEDAMAVLADGGFHGALDPVEGAVWRVEQDIKIDQEKDGERRRVFNMIAKYVRPDKVDGSYLPEITGKPAVWNWSQ